MVRCQCHCGETTTVCLSDLRNGHVQSCGCLHRETSSTHLKRVRHLGEGNRLTHGRTETPEYYIWRSMKARCLNPQSSGYRHYGARGITVCDRWLTFAAFFADMGCRPSPKHQLDRMNNNGPYVPENCRWATARQQMQNTRLTRRITHNGETQAAIVWAERLGLNSGAIAQRLRSGWSLTAAVTTPPIPRAKRRLHKHT